MFTYAQLTHGVESGQLFFNLDEFQFECNMGHYLANSHSGHCLPSCPFYSTEFNRCDLPSPHEVQAFYKDAIHKYNPEYLL